MRACAGVWNLHPRGKIGQMEKIVRKFGSFAEADAADIEEDLLIPQEQRISILLELQRRYYGDATEQGFARVYRITQLKQS